MKRITFHGWRGSLTASGICSRMLAVAGIGSNCSVGGSGGDVAVAVTVRRPEDVAAAAGAGGALLCANLDDPLSGRVVKWRGGPWRGFGLHPGRSYSGEIVKATHYSTVILAKTPRGPIVIESPLVGRMAATCNMAALAAAAECGADLVDCAEGAMTSSYTEWEALPIGDRGVAEYAPNRHAVRVALKDARHSSFRPVGAPLVALVDSGGIPDMERAVRISVALLEADYVQEFGVTAPIGGMEKHVRCATTLWPEEAANLAAGRAGDSGTVVLLSASKDTRQLDALRGALRA